MTIQNKGVKTAFSKAALSCKFFSLVCFALGIFTGPAFGQSHDYINMTRSGMISHVFFTTGLEGEVGEFYLTKQQPGTTEGEKGAQVTEKSRWKGYGVENTVGLEVLKFVRFSVSHVLSSLRKQDESTENFVGSRFSANTMFVFLAPIGNLEFGGGVFAGVGDFQDGTSRTNLFGTGHHFRTGLNYFLSPDISLSTSVKAITERKSRNDGSHNLELAEIKSHCISLGISVWK